MKMDNIVLIGMPGAGKSTVGPLVSESLNMKYIDIDTIISEKENRSPREIVNEFGMEKFLDIQEEIILGLDIEGYVIATGGSVVYSSKGMNYLKENSVVVYLELELKELISRLDQERRLARASDQSIEDIYCERIPLYEKYANVKINCTGKDVNTVLDEILQEIL